MSQQKEDLVTSVENTMCFFEGTPVAVVPDNLKSAVIKSSRFEPTINETLADLAEHYQTAILPARAYKARDKSLVEGVVKILYRRVYVATGGKIQALFIHVHFWCYRQKSISYVGVYCFMGYLYLKI